MPRSITDRHNSRGLNTQLQPGQIIDPLQLFAAPSGADYNKALSNIDINTTPHSKNLRIDDSGSFVVRAGTAVMSTASSDALLGTIIYRNKSGGEYIIRFSTIIVQLWNGLTWDNLTGPALNLDENTYIQSAAWNQYLMFTTPRGLYQLDTDLLVYSLVVTAPRAKHITVFGGRIVLSYIYNIVDDSTRIQWSAKNDSNDWSGLGSGYEDLLSSPGGITDVQHGVFPINDQEAFVVRSSSIWLMTLTGNSDAPYDFKFLYRNLLCDSPYSITAVSGGVIMLTRDDVVYITTQGPKSLGLPVISQLFVVNNDIYRATATFDTRNNEYKLVLPQLSFNNNQVVWRYSFKKSCWLQDEYKFQIRRIDSMTYQAAISIDQLPGTIDSLTGSVDQLGTFTPVPTTLFTMPGANGFSVQELTTVTTDVNSIGTVVNIPIELQTGLISASTILDTVQVNEQQFACQSPTSVVLVIEYSSDGVTWSSYSTITIPIASVPKVYRAMKTISRNQMQFRITSTSAGGLRLLAWFAFITKGGRVNI